MGGYEPPGGCWEPDLAFLHEQQVPLPSELSVSPVTQNTILKPYCNMRPQMLFVSTLKTMR